MDNTTLAKTVIPAKAGIQALNEFLYRVARMEHSGIRVSANSPDCGAARLHPGYKSFLLLAPLFLLLLKTSYAAADTALLPGDAAKGKTLHAAHCTACHDAKVYTRGNRRVQSLGGLMRQVEACNRQLKKDLPGAQVNDLIAYLNETYYRFE